MITGNPRSLSWTAEYALIGAANARPVSAAAGTASTPQGDVTAPSSAATATKMLAFMASRAPIHSTQPPNTSPGRSGVAAAPWNVRIHFIPPITGHSD